MTKFVRNILKAEMASAKEYFFNFKKVLKRLSERDVKNTSVSYVAIYYCVSFTYSVSGATKYVREAQNMNLYFKSLELVRKSRWIVLKARCVLL